MAWNEVLRNLSLALPCYCVKHASSRNRKPCFWHIVLKVIVTCILAELSYHFIEKPIRTQGFRSFSRRVFIHRIKEWKTTSVISKMSIGFIIFAILIFAGGLSGLAGEQKHPTKWTYSSQETNADTSQASGDKRTLQQIKNTILNKRQQIPIRVKRKTKIVGKRLIKRKTRNPNS